jgi:hypothetical protein
MKLVFATITTLLASITAFTQSQFGIFAGPQASIARYSVQGVAQETEFKFGFQAGAGYKIPFENRMYFAPCLFYSLKGYKVAFTRFAFPPDAAAKDNNTTIHSIELGGLLHFDLGSQPSHLFFRIGPSLDFHLFGKEKFTKMSGETVDRNMPFGFSEYEAVNGFVIFGQFSYGLTSTNNHDYGPQIHHRNYGISIGKYFTKKKIVMDTRNRE